jgi:hypothetical protein
METDRHSRTAVKSEFAPPMTALFCAFAFVAFFQYTKHDAQLSRVNPFAEDPLDAVGSFGVQVALFLALLAVARRLGLFTSGLSAVDAGLARMRTATASLLALVITLAADWISVLRRFEAAGLTGSQAKLLLLLVSISVIALGSLAFVARDIVRRESDGPPSPGNLATPLLISAAASAVLAFYPEVLRLRLLGALGTVIVGAICLFVPLRAWTYAIVPQEPAPPGRTTRSRPRLANVDWLVALAVATAAGAAIFLPLVLEAGGFHRLPRPWLAAGAYVGLEAVAVLMGFALLRKPLEIYLYGRVAAPG